MRQYQYHPDGWIYFRSEAGIYCDTPASAATDAQTVLGQAVSLPAPASPYIGLSYAPGGPLLGTTGSTQAIVTAGDNATLDTLLGDVAQLLAAQTARNAPPPQTLAQAQATKCAAIDAKTEQMRAAGFVWNGGTYPGDSVSQANWNSLAQAASAMTYPITIYQVDGVSTGTLTSAADVISLQAAMVARGLAIVQQGAALKAQVMQATTVDQVNAIVDGRT